MNVLITGSSAGLGRALALRFADAGASVVIHGRDGGRLDEVRREVESRNVPCVAVRGDLRDPATVTALMETMIREGMDILVNNAGVRYTRPQDLNLDGMMEMVAVNLVAPMFLSHVALLAFAPHGGLVVNVNSAAGKMASAGEAEYCATKWGLRGFSNSFRELVAGKGMRVLDIYLGAMKTSMVCERPDWNDLIDPVDVADEIYQLCALRGRLNVTEVEIRRKACSSMG